jgi:hypothetical protein
MESKPNRTELMYEGKSEVVHCLPTIKDLKKRASVYFGIIAEKFFLSKSTIDSN